MNIGDMVLFVDAKPLPVPRGKLVMWDIGRIINVHTASSVIEVVDLCSVKHFVYMRKAKLLKGGVEV